MENAACYFVFYTGPRKGEAQAFNTARIAVGRANNCDFQLEAFQLEQVGSHHAEVLLEDGGVYCLYDLGTKSGTFVNGERVHERCTLMNEDYVRFGQDGPEVIFRIGHPLPGKQPLPQIFPVTAELEFFSGSDAGRIFPVNAAAVSNIGRRADLEIPLDPRGDMIVSGNHCNIRYLNGHFVLSDTSRNGTYVNNELIQLQPMEILEGDVIMLGDGGPQARFHVDQAKRHYPNHRPLSPVVKSEAPSRSALKTPSTPMASAKPYSSGAPATPPSTSSITPETPGADESGAPVDGAAAAGAAGAGAAEIAGAAAGSPIDDLLGNFSDIDTPRDESHPETSPGEGLSGDLDEMPAKPDDEIEPVSSEPNETSESAPSTENTEQAPAKATTLSRLPAPTEGKFKPGKKLLFAAIGAVVVIGLLMIIFSGGDEPAKTTTARGNYDEALKTLAPVANNAGGFSVEIPKGWTTLNRENFVSAESQDKEVAVDYTRDPALTGARVKELLGRNGARVAKTVEERTVGGTKVKVFQSTTGNVRRIATLRSAGTAPLLAVLETTEDTLKKMDEETLNKLLVTNLEPKGAGPAKAATPVPTSAPTPETATAPPAPAPTAVAQTAALTTPAPNVAEPPQTQQPTVVPTPAATVAAAAETTGTTPTGNAIVSKSLKMTLTVPEGWVGTSEEADEMLMLKDNKGLEIRIARDPGELDAKATFDAMEEEKWTKDGDKIDKAFQAGEFSREDQNLMLVLIPETAKTTIVIYATSAKDFTEPQRFGISNVINQILQAQP